MIEDKVAISEILSDYDWQEVFKYAKYPRSTLPEKAPAFQWENSRDGGSLDSGIRGFMPVDVKSITAYANGYNDGDSWIMLGQLYNEDYFFLYAGCDYTGWGCGEGGGSYVSANLANLIYYALSDDDRQRLEIPLRKES